MAIFQSLYIENLLMCMERCQKGNLGTLHRQNVYFQPSETLH